MEKEQVILLLIPALLLYGCAGGQPQPPSQQQPSTYSCSNGQVVSNLSLCPQTPQVKYSTDFLRDFTENQKISFVKEYNYPNDGTIPYYYVDLTFPEGMNYTAPIVIFSYKYSGAWKYPRVDTGEWGFACYTLNKTVESHMSDFGLKLPSLVENITGVVPCNATHGGQDKLTISFYTEYDEVYVYQNMLNESFVQLHRYSELCYTAKLNDTALMDLLKNVDVLVTECEASAIYCKSVGYTYFSCNDTNYSFPATRVGMQLLVMSNSYSEEGGTIKHFTVSLMNNDNDTVDTTKLKWILDGKPIATPPCNPVIMYPGNETECEVNNSMGLSHGSYTVIVGGPKNDAVGTIVSS